MMMLSRTCARTLLVLFVTGCSVEDKNAKESVSARIDACVDGLRTNGVAFVRELESLSREVENSGDADSRKALHDRIGERLLSADIKEPSYRQQSEYAACVMRFGYHEGMGHRNETLIGAWETRLRVLNWLRGELKRLAPAVPIDLSKADRATQLTYRRWRACYNSMASEYEKTVRWMEQALLPPTLEGLSEADQKILISRVEAFLGRKIRTVRECERDAASGLAMEFPCEDDMSKKPVPFGGKENEDFPKSGFGEL